MYVNNLYRCISLYLWTIITFFAAYIQSGCDCACQYSNGSVCPRLNNFIRTLKWFFVFISMVSSDPDFISNAVIVINYCGFFCELRLFQSVSVYTNVCIYNLLYDCLGVSCISQKLIFPDFFVQSGGTYFVPRKLLPLGCPSMGQHHLHMFPVDYRNVQYYLVLDVFFIWLRSPMNSLGKQFLS